MRNSPELAAVIWDYDGTLVRTLEKNLNVTRRILREVTGLDPLAFPTLQSLENYTAANQRSANWREFYSREFGLTEEQIDEAGRSWTGFQSDDETPTPLFEGIPDVLAFLGHLPHGVVSQNSKATILEVLQRYNVDGCFRCIIGYEEVDIRRQKPEPDGLLMCIENLVERGITNVLYIGDHETDIRCAVNTNNVLRKNGRGTKVLSVGAFYSGNMKVSDWSVKPDYVAASVSDITSIAAGLR